MPVPDIAMRSLFVLALAAAFLADSGVRGEHEEVVLYAGSGKSRAGENKWAGWYSNKAEFREDKGEGKRESYDYAPLLALIFNDTDREVEYTLDRDYTGRSLLEIVKGCMGDHLVNDNSDVWRTGHCSIGTLKTSPQPKLPESILKIRHEAKVAQTLRIGVGDGVGAKGDEYDWALFMLEEDNGQTDFGGLDVYCFGSESETNTGYAGKVWIKGRKAPSAPGHSQKLRMTISGTNAVDIPSLAEEAKQQLKEFLQKEVVVVEVNEERLTLSNSVIFSFKINVAAKYSLEVNLQEVKDRINKLYDADVMMEEFTTPLEETVKRLNSQFTGSLTAELHNPSTTKPQATTEAPLPVVGFTPEEGDSPASAALVVGASIFLTACPFVCATLWCFCRPSQEGASSDNPKGKKKGVSGVDAETDIIHMIEEMGDAPDPLAVHAPVCVTLNTASDAPSSPSAWRPK